MRQRKINTCLNCGSNVEIRFCSQCGQENIETKDSFAGIVSHFLQDLLHFDGKFFVTVKLLFRRPGLLSEEYSQGRRVAYYHPIKMYLFTSAFFFFVFFTFFVPKHDSMFSFSAQEKGVDITAFNMRQGRPLTGDDNVIFRSIRQKMADRYSSGHYDDKYVFWAVLDNFLHKLPYLLFISLPIFAFYLKLFYYRNKSFYYSDHAVFLIHLYVFTFLLLSFAMLLMKLLPHGIGWAAPFYLIYAALYGYYAMLRFYKQKRGKTLMKFIFFNVCAVVSLLLLFGLFFMMALIES